MRRPTTTSASAALDSNRLLPRNSACSMNIARKVDSLEGSAEISRSRLSRYTKTPLREVNHKWLGEELDTAERVKGLEPSTVCLGSRYATTASHPRSNCLYYTEQTTKSQMSYRGGASQSHWPSLRQNCPILERVAPPASLVWHKAGSQGRMWLILVVRTEAKRIERCLS